MVQVGTQVKDVSFQVQELSERLGKVEVAQASGGHQSSETNPPFSNLPLRNRLFKWREKYLDGIFYLPNENKQFKSRYSPLTLTDNQKVILILIITPFLVIGRP